MTVDELWKIGFRSVLAVLVGLVAWIVKVTLGNRERSAIQEQKLATLEGRLSDLEEEQVRKEDIRVLLKEVMIERDNTLCLIVKQAVTEGVANCRRQRREEMTEEVELIVRRILESSHGGRD